MIYWILTNENGTTTFGINGVPPHGARIVDLEAFEAAFAATVN